MTFDPITWLRANLPLGPGSSAAFIYEHLESQSGRSLPGIYLPFDPANPRHVSDLGCVLDFALHAGTGRVLDFGPGDGWPSLDLAPLVREVVGVESCPKRTETCRNNATRLAIRNATFLHVPDGAPLPFPDDHFDGATAASSLEQSVDPKAALREILRVLRPGGRLRMSFESLQDYRGEEERDLWIFPSGEREMRILFYDRHIDGEYVDHVGLVLKLSQGEIGQSLARYSADGSYRGISEPLLREWADQVQEACQWRTLHPSCATWLAWLREAGFREAVPTRGGGPVAGEIWHNLPAGERPSTREALNALLRVRLPDIISRGVSETPGSADRDPWITAKK